jgi:hypothetical protein
MEGIGTGLALVFSTSDYQGEVLSASISGEEIPVIDMAHMGTTGYRPKVFGQLIEPPQVSVEINYDPGNPPPVGEVDTATITWPDGATLSGTGAFISRESETPLEDKMTGTYVFQFDGQTGPTYDDGVTT